MARMLNLPLDRLQSKGVTVVAAAAGAVAGWMNQPVIYVMLGITFLDIMTGLIKARAKNAGESSKWFKGVYRLITYWIIGTVLMALGSLGTINMMIADMMATLVILGEIVSIVENLQDASKTWGIELPGIPLLVRVLKLRQDQLVQQLETTGTGPLPQETPAPAEVANAGPQSDQ